MTYFMYVSWEYSPVEGVVFITFSLNTVTNVKWPSCVTTAEVIKCTSLFPHSPLQMIQRYHTSTSDSVHSVAAFWNVISSKFDPYRYEDHQA